MKPHKCPVCNGSGLVLSGIVTGLTGSQATAVPCHGCQGRGWVGEGAFEEAILVELRRIGNILHVMADK